MTEHVALQELLKEVKVVGAEIVGADKANKDMLEELKKALGVSDGKLVKLDEVMKGVDGKCATLEQSINDLWKKHGRPGASIITTTDDETKERKHAIDFLEMLHEDRQKKKDMENLFKPTEEQIKSAVDYRKALRVAINTIDHNTLPSEVRKSLSAFSFGTNGFILAPEMSNRVISCIVDPTDIAGLMDSMTTSSPSVKFLIDNQRMALAGWACEASCFAVNPQPDLQQGLGELEIKPESLRYIACVSRDLLEDASINIESWIMGKVSDGMRTTINNTLILGDGISKPLGILNPNAGIPIVDTAPLTPPGQFTWQDVVMLSYEVPMEWRAGSTYLMNQRTFALLMTMGDGINRPLWGQLPGGAPGFTLAGLPIQIVTQMPDVRPGATPIAFGNWKRVYMIVWRKQVTMQTDPYSAGFCVLYKFDARVGGGILCPNAARLLRIR